MAQDDKNKDEMNLTEMINGFYATAEVEKLVKIYNSRQKDDSDKFRFCNDKALSKRGFEAWRKITGEGTDAKACTIIAEEGGSIDTLFGFEMGYQENDWNPKYGAQGRQNDVIIGYLYSQGENTFPEDNSGFWKGTATVLSTYAGALLSAYAVSKIPVSDPGAAVGFSAIITLLAGGFGGGFFNDYIDFRNEHKLKETDYIAQSVSTLMEETKQGHVCTGKAAAERYLNIG